MTKRLEEARANVALEFEYATYDNHLICGCCGAKQSFTEWKTGARRCPKDACKGTLFRHRHLWVEVQKSFLDRWTAGLEKAKRNMEKLEKETMPPFRLLKRTVFDKESGEMVEEDIVTPDWEACAEHFFERQQEAIDRVEARKAAAEAEAKKLSEKVVIAQIKSNPCAWPRRAAGRRRVARALTAPPVPPRPVPTQTSSLSRCPTFTRAKRRRSRQRT